MLLAAIVFCIVLQANGSSLRSRSASPSCQCVQMHECDVETLKVITDGRGIAEFKSSEPSGCDDGLICCELPEGTFDDESRENPESFEDRPAPQTKSQQCGIANRLDTPKALDLHFRVSGLAEAIATDQGQIPWMLALIHTKEIPGSEPLKQFYCGATLYTMNIAITAGHCVDRFKPEELLLIAGEWDIMMSGETETPQENQVKEILIHPDYTDRPSKNDIALLKVKTPFVPAFSVNPVCLATPEFDLETASECYAAGWGAKDVALERHEDAKLKRTRLPYVPHKQCEESFQRSKLGRLFTLHRSFLCFGGVPGADTCKGDGGGPLTCDMMRGQTKISYLVGITSWGVGCGERPAAYTNVPYFYDWIVEAAIKLEEIN